MIIIKLIGGLGNQMFQYAIGKHLAMINRTRLYLDISDYYLYPDRYYALDCFDVEAEIATAQLLADFKAYPHNLGSFQRLWRYHLLGERNVIIQEPHFHFANDMLKPYEANVHLSGYWQTEKYFSRISLRIRKDFRFAKPLSLRNDELAKQIANSESVSIHVRRGDYISNNITNQYHGVCDLGYFQTAIRFIVDKIRNPTFFVFSDDMDWVTSHLKIEHKHYLVGHNQGTESYNDMRLMSLCKYNIIANSSFSWWGAWLNANEEKIVVAPKYWLNPNSTWYKDWKVSMDDYVPANWHQVENSI